MALNVHCRWVPDWTFYQFSFQIDGCHSHSFFFNMKSRFPSIICLVLCISFHCWYEAFTTIRPEASKYSSLCNYSVVMKNNWARQWHNLFLVFLDGKWALSFVRMFINSQGCVRRRMTSKLSFTQENKEISSPDLKNTRRPNQWHNIIIINTRHNVVGTHSPLLPLNTSKHKLLS